MTKLVNVKTFEMNFEIHDHLFSDDTLFIHGNLASNSWWQPSIEVWNERANAGLPGRALLGEWRGCGKTAPPSDVSDLSPRKLARDYIDALRGLEVRECQIVAHSTGGLIALYAMLEAPDLFTSAVFLDPVGARGAKLSPEILGAFKQMSEDRDFCALVMRGTIHEPLGDQQKLFERIVDDAFGVAPLIWTAIPEILSKIDLVSDLLRISQPVLILHGELDSILPVSDSRELAKDLPNAELRILPGRGHSTNVEDPNLFVKLVDEFFETH